jgi:hypothetical protein
VTGRHTRDQLFAPEPVASAPPGEGLANWQPFTLVPWT